MDQTAQLAEEIKKLNQRIDSVNNKGRLMIYNANPFKFALFNFLAGLFHSLGNIIGTFIITIGAVIILSKMNFGQMINNFIQQTLVQNQQTIEKTLKK